MPSMTWRIVHTTFSLEKPNNAIYMFGLWLQRVRWKEKNVILIGVSDICRAIWLSRNNIIFNELDKQTCLHVRLRATHCIKLWVLL
jgi:hypothetical protein